VTWTATSGQNTLIGDSGNLTNVVMNNGLGTIFKLVDVPNDGTAAGLAAGVKARLAARDASSGVRQFVPAGTVLDLTSPAVTPPPTPPAGFDTWVSAWNAYLHLARLLSQDVPSVTQARVDSAKANHESLYDPSFEAFV
jgi:hypothetical protein